MSLTPDKAAEVVALATAWLGTPYHHQGRVQGVGVDCAMILADVYHAAGLIPLIDPRPYPPDWHFHRDVERYLGWVQQYADPVTEGDPQPGDVALYRFGRCVSHGAIVVAWPTVIHAYRGLGVVMSEGDQGALAGRLAGVWRVRTPGAPDAGGGA